MVKRDRLTVALLLMFYLDPAEEDKKPSTTIVVEDEDSRTTTAQLPQPSTHFRHNTPLPPLDFMMTGQMIQEAPAPLFPPTSSLSSSQPMFSSNYFPPPSFLERPLQPTTHHPNSINPITSLMANSDVPSILPMKRSWESSQPNVFDRQFTQNTSQLPATNPYPSLFRQAPPPHMDQNQPSNRDHNSYFHQNSGNNK
jgi:hypothetical protein